MATKTGILAYILARWGDITSPKRLPTLDREVSTALVNELYPTKVTDNESTTTVLTVALSGISYTINLWKQGNNVNVSGRITNGTGGSISGVDIITISNSEYFADATALNPFRFYGNNVLFLVTNTNKIRVGSTLGAGAEVSFNFNYKTVD